MSAANVGNRARRRSAATLFAVTGLALGLLGPLLLASGNGEDEGLALTLAAPVGPPVALDFPDGRPVEKKVLSAHAAVRSASGWTVLDNRGHQLVFLSEDGAFLRAVGRGGNGPGELRTPISLTKAGDAFVVLEVDGRLLTFDLEGAHLHDSRIPPSGECFSSTVQRVLGGDDGLHLLTTCTTAPGQFVARIGLLTREGETRTVLERPVQDARGGTVDPYRFPILASVDGTPALGIVGERCLRLADPRADGVERVCYPDLPLAPLPDSLRRTFDRSFARAIREGIRVTLPESLPPFLEVIDGDGAWGFLTVTEQGEYVLDLVRGDGLRRLTLPPRVRAFPSRDAILLVREELDGTSFAVVPIP